jgi:hypothetical protein
MRFAPPAYAAQKANSITTPSYVLAADHAVSKSGKYPKQNSARWRRVNGAKRAKTYTADRREARV